MDVLCANTASKALLQIRRLTGGNFWQPKMKQQQLKYVSEPQL